MIEIYAQKIVELEFELQQLKKRLANKDLEIISLEIENHSLREASNCEWESIDAISA